LWLGLWRSRVKEANLKPLREEIQYSIQLPGAIALGMETNMVATMKKFGKKPLISIP
jgi:hypothetical protein